MKEGQRKSLERIGYRFVGPSRHSAIKTCEWTRNSLRGKGTCYKQKFYGIESHRCMQLSVGVECCNHRCVFCWRDTDITLPKWTGRADDPKDILDSALESHRGILQGFGGNSKTDKKMFSESLSPMQVAVSLAGEPTLYPKLPQMVDEIRKRGMTAFVVSNGTNPEMIKSLLKHQPTNLYITLPAPDAKTYEKTCRPLIKDGWKRIMKSLALLKEFECNTVLRLTLVRNLNFSDPAGYAKIIKKYQPMFVEVKAFMSVGFSRKRLPYTDMPLHPEIRKFAEEIARESGYEIADEKPGSRVVLLKRVQCIFF